jgi:hypothetical protein
MLKLSHTLSSFYERKNIKVDRNVYLTKNAETIRCYKHGRIKE